MPAAITPQYNGVSEAHAVETGVPNKGNGKLILCFDGTGNSFSANTSDTNIVKLYQKFDREAPDQYHYYQREFVFRVPFGSRNNGRRTLFRLNQSAELRTFIANIRLVIAGIGTYSTDTSSLNPGLWGKFKRWWSETLDEGIGTTFDQHVIAGYRFAMRYHNDGDRIFMFGFSRGAFTARFLARMIAAVGLLSKGNEEMVPFAYRTYQEYEMGEGSKFKTVQDAEDYMKSFKTAFCRARTRVHFLGLFDTVNSVGYFENPFARRKYLPSVLETATHVRHAVAIDERRCKFKVALLQQEKVRAKGTNEDIKEVFFPGGHGDVGGGWLAEGGKAKLEADDALQLSDLALEWMIGELEALPVKHPKDQIAWNEHKDIFLKNFDRKVSNAVQAPLHDILKWGNCVSRTQTFMWRIMGVYSFFHSGLAGQSW